VNRFSIKNLKKYFERGGYFSKKDRHLVLNIKSMDIPENLSVGLIGESGSGKSTIARLLMNIIRPDEGSIEYFGKSLGSLGKEEMRDYRQKCQIIFQDPSSQFNPRMNIYEILREPLLINGIDTGVEDRIKQTLELVSLPQDISTRYIHQISGGQRQRISIARALILNPSFIICDEPVSALDISVQSQILNLLYDLRFSLNVNYLMISHDLSVVRFLCDYVYILYNGIIVECGKTSEIFGEPLHPYTRELIDAAMLKTDDNGIFNQKSLSDEKTGTSLCPFVRCPRFNECGRESVEERKVTGTHRVFCNL